jgi:SAM-dependent methyltransferase
MKGILQDFVRRVRLASHAAAVRGAFRNRRSRDGLQHLAPVLVARDRRDFHEALGRTHFARDAEHGHAQVLRETRSGRLHLQRSCLCCNRTTKMLVDLRYGSEQADGTRIPNWRERLVCSGCGMNNRQRLVARLLEQATTTGLSPSIYLMEQVTPISSWVAHLPGRKVHGSEYLGHQYTGGEQVRGVRHEDVMNLSYPDESFDLIVSNDVLEHIPDPRRAFRECFRVLKPEGAVLATFPFHVGKDETVVRARLAGNGIEHLLPPEYHGNPLSSDGSLVFHDFGWDVLDMMKDAGFASADCEMYSSDEFGHLGPGLLVFRAGKAHRAPAA